MSQRVDRRRLHHGGFPNCEFVAQVPLMQRTYPSKVRPERVNEVLWQQCDAVLLPLGIANHELLVAKVDVLDSQPQALEQAQARSVDESGHQPRCALQLTQHGPHFLARRHYRQAPRLLGSLDIAQPWQLDLQHISIKKQDRTQSLILGGRRNVALTGEIAEKGCELIATNVTRVALAVKEDEPPDPLDIRLLAAALIWVGAIYKRRLFQAVLRDDEETRALQSVSIDSAGLSVVTGEASSRCTWSSFKDYFEDEVAVYLFMDLSHAVIVPKQSFGSAEELGQFREWARSSNNSLESDVSKATRASG